MHVEQFPHWQRRLVGRTETRVRGAGLTRCTCSCAASNAAISFASDNWTAESSVTFIFFQSRSYL